MNLPAHREPPAAIPSDARVIATTRVIITFAGLVIFSVAPLPMATPAWIVQIVLALYTLYALALYVAVAGRTGVVQKLAQWEHWGDVAWSTVIIGLTAGTQSNFGYFFPMLIASFRWGFASGMRVALVSAALLVTVGLVAAPPPPDFELQRFLIRPVFLVAFGYVIASRGGFELRLRERLRFLKDVGTVSNPRFGVDRTIGVLLHRLRALYGANVAAMITRDPLSGRDEMRRVVSGEPESSVPPETIPAGLASSLLRLPPQSALAYAAPGRVRVWPVGAAGRDGFAGADVGRDDCEAMAGLWEAKAFAAVSIVVPRETVVTIVLAFADRVRIEEDDVAFIAQVIEHSLPMIDNIRLVDYLATSSAIEERKRIARDLHDSVIQPYVGIRLGLAGLQHKVAGESPAVRSEVDRLLGMTTAGIDDLRGQIASLRADEAPGGGLLPAIARFATRYREFTGIDVDVVAGDVTALSDRVAGEVFQLVTEGLSNVRRHSGAGRAAIRLDCPNGHVALRIENDGAGAGTFIPFIPRSIHERAVALGGRVAVTGRADGGAVVEIEIPL
ncbi:MAG TPA: histidine kinase [Candidatus Polarisedimenticolaceae bacterium]|nr:histidine kinase [Candidatus Polarisedimenticolaceae bacterium]